jgi:hypothetical protein
MIDTTPIIVGVIAALASFGGSVLASNKTQAVMEERITHIREDIAKLSDRVDKHNNLIERTAVLERDVKTIFNRVDGLKMKE